MPVTKPAVAIPLWAFFLCFTEKIIPKMPAVTPNRGTIAPITTLKIPSTSAAIPKPFSAAALSTTLLTDYCYIKVSN